MTEDHKESIRLLNGITLLGVPICLFYLVLFGITGFAFETILFAGGVVLFILPIFENRYIGLNASRVLSSVLTPIFFGFVTVILGADSGFYLGFLVIIPPPILFFGKIHKSIPYVAFGILCMAGSIVVMNFVEPTSEVPYTRLIYMVNLVTVLAAQVVVVGFFRNEILQNRLILRVKNKEILDSINYAQRIQTAILPPTQFIRKNLNQVFILYKPKDIVAGDFYWMEATNEGVLFAVADCTGHGVPGAMVSVICNNALNRSVREYRLTDPGKILDKTREIVTGEFEKSEDDVKDGMDIALCRLQGERLYYSGAHNPLWIIRNNELIEIKANKQPVGKFDQSTPFNTHEVKLEKGDYIYLFSDGFADQFGGDSGKIGGKKYKTARFKKFLVSIQNLSIEAQKEAINKEFEDWKKDIEQLDDVCILGVKI